MVTDHYSLKWLHNLKDPTGRLARWALKLQQYSFEIVHRKGKEHVVPDALSRSVPVLEPAEVCAGTHSSGDAWYKEMVAKVRNRPEKFPLWSVRAEGLYKLVSGSGGHGEWKKVLAKGDRSSLLKRCHDDPTAGHGGVSKTFHRLSSQFYWPRMRAEVAKYVRSCRVCQSVKVEPQKPRGFLLPQPDVDGPWQMVSLDLVGALPKSPEGFMHILVVVDYFTKYAVLFPLRAATAHAVQFRLENEIFLVYGVPRLILVDNGKQFACSAFRNLCAEYGVRIRFNAGYHPQANPTERVNRTIKDMLRSYLGDNQRRWPDLFPKIGLALRTGRHDTTGYTPFFLNFGREHVLCGTEHTTLIDENSRASFSNKLSDLQDIFRLVQTRIKALHVRNSKGYNLRRRDSEFTETYRNFALSDAARYFSAKLAPRFVGPFVIKKKLSLWTYELAEENGKSCGVFHAKDLKPFYARARDESSMNVDI